ncbi:MAG: hypothetical protein Q7T72_06675 [Bacteroidales bacterium]|nr:hypothetical protein [Bacteroidales bacterium]MDP3003149.1 hypothetical protein [Bacteroidales bacterium]
MSKGGKIVIFIIAVSTMLALGAAQQVPASQKYAIGDVIQIKNVRLTVNLGTRERFPNVTMNGTPVVVEMRFTAPESILLWFRPGPKPQNSDLNLLVGDMPFAPVAQTDDRPLVSPQERKPVLMSQLELAATGKSFIGWNIKDTQTVWWLFDLPVELQNAPKRAALKFDLGDDAQSLLIDFK